MMNPMDCALKLIGANVELRELLLDALRQIEQTTGNLRKTQVVSAVLELSAIQ